MLFSLLHRPPRAGFVARGCNDKDIANAFHTVIGLGALVSTLGAVRRKKSYPIPKLQRRASLLQCVHSDPKGNPPEGPGGRIKTGSEGEGRECGGSGDFPGGMRQPALGAWLLCFIASWENIVTPSAWAIAHASAPVDFVCKLLAENYTPMLGWLLPARSCFPVSLTFIWHVELLWYFLNV